MVNNNEIPDIPDMPEQPYYLRDTKVDEAQRVLSEYIESKRGIVFYMKQLEVKFEKRFFHWITANALNKLIGNELREERATLRGNVKIKFVFHKNLRYYRRQLKEKLKLVKAFSAPDITRAFGRQAEVLFFNSLVARGFKSHGHNTREFQKRKWTKTSHDLDFIIERDKIAYGCEVKNRFDYIEDGELKIKLEMCKFLGIRPLFIMRFSPKTYNWRIITQNGYAMLFETQIYPFGFNHLVDEIKAKLDLPVDCPRAIPEGIIIRFIKWHERKRGRESGKKSRRR